MKNILLDLEESLLIPDGGASASSVGAGFGIWGFIRMILILLLLVGALYGVLRIIRKANPRFAQDDGKIKIVSSKALVPGKMLYIVETGGKRLLIGSSDHSVNLISELNEAEEDKNA